MSAVRFRMALALFWLLLGVGLLLRGWIVPPDVLARYDGSRLSFAGWFALALAAWNGVWAFRTVAMSRPAALNPLRRDRTSRSSSEYHAEFDFDGPGLLSTDQRSRPLD